MSILGAPLALPAEQTATIDSHSLIEPSGASVVRKHLHGASPWTGQRVPNPWSRDTTELYWDDGIPEAYYVVTNPPGPNDRMAVRFGLPGPPPMKVVGGRLYSYNHLPFRSFSVCRDAGGYPDVFHPIDRVDNASGGDPGWGWVDFHGAVFDSGDVWAVIHWIPGYMVGIGADSSAPDSNSYWCNQREAVNWNQWTATDWMMRLSVATVTDSHDVTAVSILEPPGRFLPGDTANPTAVFGNCGLSPETFDVAFDITDSIGGLVYSSTQSITLASCEVETVTFVPEWIETNEGMYTYKAYTSLAGDADPANDTVRMQGLCTREIVITYCGDYTNWGSSIIGTWATNRKYLVRMTPPVPAPFYIRRAQIFLIEANAPLEYLCVCPDDGTGLPDTADVLAIAHDISVPQMLSWTTAQFAEVEVTDSVDLWVIAKWPEGITEPHIGFETNTPTSERSWRYYFKDGQGHYENLGVPPYYREWYFRLIIAVPPVGIEEMEKPKVGSGNWALTVCPNPFGAGGTTISLSVPRCRLPVSLKVYDLCGRLIRTLFDSPLTTDHLALTTAVSWDGRNDRGERVPSGMYFLKLSAKGGAASDGTAGDFQPMKKVTVLR